MMTRKLLVVFASGALIALACLGLAWVVGGNDFRGGFSEDGEGWNWTIGDDAAAKGPKKSREFAFDGSQPITFAVPVELHFTRGDVARMVVRGPAATIDRLEWTGQTLKLTGKGVVRHGFDVTIVAPQIAAINVDAAADIDLAGLDQEEFRLGSNGAVDLTATGKVRRLFIDSAGASDIDLAGVEAVDATVRISGVGDIDLAATGTVDVDIAGAGDVTLHKKPQVLRKSIGGIGSVDEAY